MSTPMDRHAGPPYDDRPRKKKRGCLPWVLGTLILLLVLVSCTAILSGGEDPAPTPAPQETTAPQTVGPPPETTTPTPEETEGEETITLSGTADGPGTVNWGTLEGSGNTDEFVGEWSIEVPADNTKTYTVYISPAYGGGATEVSCTITEDGKEPVTATGTGEYGSASCVQSMW